MRNYCVCSLNKELNLTFVFYISVIKSYSYISKQNFSPTNTYISIYSDI